ncbi:MAG TPA: hydroxysqualene dehydroxylase HpnE [bacterium]|nr:hydroxysqualene dehydroxylase HpnE [bacterium]HNB56547.1 hydroxysqualene dehydroxylase HpnE [bacterium]HNC49196.1 hydroxysqualene dehydroxylase HpnE [bacterium]HND76281.1 hydroxysqualene dehydroxylase HpnE [bacterium]HNI10309.1 hydroxysqualene dehydroxylase HpnE [bacterium]
MIALTVAKSPSQIIIIGAGTAGLAAATTLAQAGYDVSLYEKNAYAGGRTFSFTDVASRSTLDNGQHLLMGCYHATRAWLDSLNASLDIPKKSFPLNFYSADGRIACLSLPDWPAPWYALYGIMRYDAIPLSERWRILRAGLSMRKSLIRGRYVSDWLDAWRFTQDTRRWFWNPICLAIMNQHPDDADLVQFGEAMRRIFFGSRDDGRFIISEKSLDAVLVEPAVRFLKQKSCSLHFHSFVRHITVSNGRVEGITLRNGETIRTDIVIMAVPPWSAGKLLPVENEWTSRLQNFSSAPILSAYIWLNEMHPDALFDGPMAACIGTHVQWVFKKNSECIQITISHPGASVFDAASIWEKRITDDMTLLFKNFKPSSVRRIEMIKSVRATSNNHAKDSYRFHSRTGIQGLYLAGDWIADELPSTIESAVLSGIRCAEAVLQDEKNKRS